MESIFGQSSAVNLLLQATREHHRHHAWVFCGPKGVGKCTTAVQFAELLLQTNKQGAAAHPDLHLIQKEDVNWSQNPALRRRKQTNIPLDLLRERIIGGRTSDGRHHDSIAFKTPVLGKEKVFIIDEAELLDEAGQNALLKTLEEPPVGTTIILVTSREDLLLPTVLSRCQQISFSWLDNDSMLRWAECWSPDISPAELSWAITFSCGSPGLVCEAVEAGLPALASSLSEYLSAQEQVNCTDVVAQLVSFVETNVSCWVKENPNMSKDAANRRAIQLILLMFGLSARELIRGGGCEVGIASAGILVDIEGQLSTNISIKVLIESLVVRWSHLSVGDAVFM